MIENEVAEDGKGCSFSCIGMLWVHPEALFSSSDSDSRFCRQLTFPWRGDRRDASTISL
jgi:hypothetical protein